MSLSLKQLTAYLALLAIGGGTGVFGSRYLEARHPQPAPPQAQPVVMSPSTIAPSPIVEYSTTEFNNPNFIAEAVERVGPAVVRIDATRMASSPESDALESPLFRHFFGDRFPQPSERIERGTGSGFILSEDGRILTNAHVVDGADGVKVRLKDGRVLDGKVLGSDPLTDVAAIKVEATGLPTAPLAPSDHLVAGQWAIAIGNPLGLDNTVTVGIISAIDRSSAQVGMSRQQRVRFIQTDAAINPGNSGGPLLNDRGEVIGINTAIRANAQGLGFAIPIETAHRIAHQIFTKGRADHPFLGIQMVNLNPVVKEQLSEDEQFNFSLDQEGGVVVVEVQKDSPADEAGLKPGDLIQAIDGVAINSGADVQAQVEASEIGAVLEIEVNRQGKTQLVEVRPQAFPVN